MSSRRSSNTTTTVTQPYTPQLPYQQAGWNEAVRLYDQGTQVPSAYGSILARAREGSPEIRNAKSTLNELYSAGGIPGASPMLNSIASGAYVNQNPYITKLYDQAAGSVRSQVNSQFAGAGRYGSGAHQGVLGNQLSQLANQMYGDNYARERQAQLQAAIAASDQDQRGAQANVAKRLQAVAQAQSLADFDYRELERAAQVEQAQIQAPWLNLARYLGLLDGGNYGGVVQQTSPFDSTASTLGNLKTAVDVAAGLKGLFK